MGAWAYFSHPIVDDFWELMCMSRGPDQVAIMCEAKPLVFKSPIKLGTHLTTYCRRVEKKKDKRENRSVPCPFSESEIRYHSATGPTKIYLSDNNI
ncbi:hypothetical protein TNCV_5068141 [Trichonephila clavipes]|nr:hypothetical protein TNCV_5068141 [Trichonephila clavipes]